MNKIWWTRIFYSNCNHVYTSDFTALLGGPWLELSSIRTKFYRGLLFSSLSLCIASLSQKIMVGDDLTGVELQLRQVREKFTEQQKSLSAADSEAWFALVGDLQKVVTEMDQLLQRNSKQMNVSFLLNHESSVHANASAQTLYKNGTGTGTDTGNSNQHGQLAVKLDRTAFYAESSPFQHQMDRSGSFRFCPPMAHTTAVDYFSNNTQAPLLISDGQILENLANLKRLGEMQNR